MAETDPMNVSERRKYLHKMRLRYWGIENGLHYRRDVTFHEDRLRIGKVAGQAMAAVNNLVISLFNHLGYKNHAQARREFDTRSQKALALLCGL